MCVTLNAAEKNKWLTKDIPHRVRAALARLDLLNQILGTSAPADPVLQTDDQVVRRRCETDAIWEGRLAATRWLIDFVGITKGGNGAPARPRPRPGDVRIAELGGGEFSLTSTDAQVLADVWKGCSQGASHPTETRNAHPRVNEPELSRALAIIKSHLQTELYAKANLNLDKIALSVP